MEVEVPKSLQDKRKEEKEILSSSMLSNLIAVPTVQATTQEKQTKSPQKVQQQFTSKEYSIPVLPTPTTLLSSMMNNFFAGNKKKKNDFLIPKLSNTIYTTLFKSLETHKEKQSKSDQLLVQLHIINQNERLKDELVASLFTSYYFYDFLPHQQERGGLIKRTLDAENKQMR